MTVDLIPYAEVFAPNPRYLQTGGAMDYECLLCRRPMTEKAVATAWHVRLMNGGTHLAPNDWEPTSDRERAGDMGCHEVGSECAKKIPLTHRRKL